MTMQRAVSESFHAKGNCDPSGLTIVATPSRQLAIRLFLPNPSKRFN
jgi:hypothetical protein